MPNRGVPLHRARDGPASLLPEAAARVGKGHAELDDRVGGGDLEGHRGGGTGALAEQDQSIVWPPFTVSRSPVMKDAESDARNDTAPAMSSGTPIRPSGTSSR